MIRNRRFSRQGGEKCLGADIPKVALRHQMAGVTKCGLSIATWWTGGSNRVKKSSKFLNQYFHPFASSASILPTRLPPYRFRSTCFLWNFTMEDLTDKVEGTEKRLNEPVDNIRKSLSRNASGQGQFFINFPSLIFSNLANGSRSRGA
jgi:hypothetical protein